MPFHIESLCLAQKIPIAYIPKLTSQPASVVLCIRPPQQGLTNGRRSLQQHPLGGRTGGPRPPGNGKPPDVDRRGGFFSSGASGKTLSLHIPFSFSLGFYEFLFELLHRCSSSHGASHTIARRSSMPGFLRATYDSLQCPDLSATFGRVCALAARF